MSLVAYGSSDESEDDSLPKEEKSTPDKGFTNLPVKRSRESVKITIPSLKEFEKDENEEAPKKKPKYKPGSGLFSILPPPKNISLLSEPGFMPHVLKSKTEKRAKSSLEKTIKPTKKSIVSPTASKPIEQDDEEDALHDAEDKFDNSVSTSGVDFFSLDSSTDNVSNHNYESPEFLSTVSPTIVNNESFSPNNLHKPLNSVLSPEIETMSFGGYSGELQKPLTDIYQSEASYVPDDASNQYLEESASEPNPVDDLLNDEGFRKLQGKRGEFEGINFIDVNAADQLSDQKEWLMKSLTEESTHRPSRKKHNMPTQQQRRKHQITYLAFQAKERELDLKNQWSLNNRTRRETQAKYGF